MAVAVRRGLPGLSVTEVVVGMERETSREKEKGIVGEAVGMATERGVPGGGIRTMIKIKKGRGETETEIEIERRGIRKGKEKEKGKGREKRLEGAEVTQGLNVNERRN